MDKVKPIILDGAVIAGLDMLSGGGLNQDLLVYAGGISAAHNLVTKDLVRSNVPKLFSITDPSMNRLLCDGISYFGLQAGANYFYYQAVMDWKSMIVRTAALLGGQEFIGKKYL